MNTRYGYKLSVNDPTVWTNWSYTEASERAKKHDLIIVGIEQTVERVIGIR